MSGTDAEHGAFRRRLGIVLNRGRTKLSKYTQQSIADELGVDVETVGRWERGEREPKAYQLHRLADLYGIPWDLALNPPDSISEIDERIATLRQVAVEAARVAAEEELDRQGADGRVARRGTPRAGKPSRSPR